MYMKFQNLKQSENFGPDLRPDCLLVVVIEQPLIKDTTGILSGHTRCVSGLDAWKIHAI